MSLSSVKSETALRSRLFSSSRSFRRFTCSLFSSSSSWRHREYVTSLTPIADCVHHVLALRDQNIDLPQLRNDLFRLVSLHCHCSPPGCQRHTSSRTTSMGAALGHPLQPFQALASSWSLHSDNGVAALSDRFSPFVRAARRFRAPSATCFIVRLA